MNTNEFEWVKEIPTYITIEKNTLYYFPNGGYINDLINTINPTQSYFIEWFQGLIQDGYDKINYFITEDSNDVREWCNSSPVYLVINEYGLRKRVNLDEI